MILGHKIDQNKGVAVVESEKMRGWPEMHIFRLFEFYDPVYVN